MKVRSGYIMRQGRSKYAWIHKINVYRIDDDESSLTDNHDPQAKPSTVNPISCPLTAQSQAIHVVQISNEEAQAK